MKLIIANWPEKPPLSKPIMFSRKGCARNVNMKKETRDWSSHHCNSDFAIKRLLKFIIKIICLQNIGLPYIETENIYIELQEYLLT